MREVFRLPFFSVIEFEAYTRRDGTYVPKHRRWIRKRRPQRLYKLDFSRVLERTAPQTTDRK